MKSLGDLGPLSASSSEAPSPDSAIMTVATVESRTPVKKRALGLPSRDIIWPFALVTTLFFLWGFAYGLLDVLNKHFQDTLDITKLQSTGLQVAYFGLGYFGFSPIAGEVLRRKGYKFTILMGLSLYSLGAIFFWPVAKFSAHGNKGSIFAGFVVCTGVIACGLGSLETAANSYITCLPGTDPSTGAFRLQLSQSFNGVAAFAGPFIASKYFFSGGNSSNLNNVQWVYLAVSLMGATVATAFGFTKLPETSEAELQAQVNLAAEASGRATNLDRPFYRLPRPFFGFLAQFLYVGAQVTIGAFFVNYVTESVGWSNARASTFLSYSLIMFTVGRYVGVAFLTRFPAELLIGIWSAACVVFITLATFLPSVQGLAFLMLVYFFESPLFPCLFVVSTTKLGVHTRRASSLLISAVGGGAVFPPIQGAIADRHGTRISMAVCIPCFLYISGFGFYLWWHHGHKFHLDEKLENLTALEPALETIGRTEYGHHFGKHQGSIGHSTSSNDEFEIRAETEKSK